MKKGAVNVCFCEVCGKRFVARRRGMKYCANKCRQWAYQNRKRVERKALNYGLTAEQNQDLLKIQTYSEKAYGTVLRVASIAGSAVASEVLDACWDILANTGSLRRSGVDDLLSSLLT